MLRQHVQDRAGDDGLDRSVAAVTAALKTPPDDPLLVSGLYGGAVSLWLAEWFARCRRPAMIVAPTAEMALELADDLETWLGRDEVLYLPQQEVLAFDRNSPDPALVGDFLTGLHALRDGAPRLAVSSLYGVRHRVIAPQRLAKATLPVKVGQCIDLDDFCTRLAECGYRPAAMVARVGDYARRGGLLDVFAPGNLPLRIEFFADEIVSLRHFEADTQRSSDRCQEARIVPVSHLILDDDAQLACLARCEEGLAAGEIERDELDDLEARLEEKLVNDGLETFLPFFGPTAEVSDYLSESTVMFWYDPVRLSLQSDLLDTELPTMRETRRKRDPILPTADDLVVPIEKLARRRLPQVFLTGAWIAGDESGHWLGHQPGQEFACGTSRPDLKGGDVVRLRQQLLAWERDDTTILLLCDNRGQADRLGDLLAGDDLLQPGDPPAVGAAPDDTAEATPATRPLVGSLSGGFLWPDAGLVCLTDHEFFERYRRPSRVRQRSSGLVKDRASLKPGEFVVHLEYGVGRYRGLRRIFAENVEHECLLIEYAEGGKVYVPVAKIDQVERFNSDAEANPPLARLGSGAWLRVTKRARKAIRAVAAELLELYAARKAQPGHACGPDQPMQKALEDSFLFDETPDQLAAITDTKRDMEQTKPMDRLICGDVGFGKTEVAIRAAFKAVSDGKQVAVLCPTTLLAQQHGETFGERLREYPVRTETISRFRSAKEQKQIVAATRAGEVDILIGTHRLLSRDIKFADLGLLIVDEEQRFGVRHKERIKELRRLVDVITLSATPIPRTLYLALMSARDMSLINTPPRDRLPIQTELCAFDEEVLTEAILREMHRGGQVFFVHNRVQTIEATANVLRQLVPNARVAHAHGQMKEHQLEQIMIDFLDHDFDVLVTTAIIESGLDMPRVNTIIIDRADRFGLAQLYQLRGRVGRSNHRAFAYLMTPPGERLTPEARRRLSALEEFQALGSGYHIAMRDLEIRGAGNLLGEEQHGHLEAIGFDLYCRLLEETVAELQGGNGVAPLDVKVDLRLAAYLPDDYVGDPQQKMDLYRRLARVREPEVCERLREEFIDRFGPLPEAVANLIDVTRIRVLAGRNGIEEIKAGRQGLDFFFAGGQEPSPTIIRGLMEAGPSGLQFKAVDQFVMRIPARREQMKTVSSVILTKLDQWRA